MEKVIKIVKKGQDEGNLLMTGKERMEELEKIRE